MASIVLPKSGGANDKNSTGVSVLTAAINGANCGYIMEDNGIGLGYSLSTKLRYYNAYGDLSSFSNYGSSSTSGREIGWSNRNTVNQKYDLDILRNFDGYMIVSSSNSNGRVVSGSTTYSPQAKYNVSLKANNTLNVYCPTGSTLDSSNMPVTTLVFSRENKKHTVISAYLIRGNARAFRSFYDENGIGVSISTYSNLNSANSFYTATFSKGFSGKMTVVSTSSSCGITIGGTKYTAGYSGGISFSSGATATIHVPTDITLPEISAVTVVFTA